MIVLHQYNASQSSILLSYQHMLILALLLCFLPSLSPATPSPQCSEVVSQMREGIPLSQAAQKLHQRQCAIRLFPRYRWAQNNTHILMKVEFLTSTETTPCEELLGKELTVNFSTVEVRVVCLHQGTYIIDYFLHIRTFKGLNFNFARWTQEGQNTFVLECMKSPSPYFWPILHSREHPPERKPKIWWEIIHKYQDQLAQVIDKLELEEEEQADVSERVRGKKKKVSKGESIQFYCNAGDPLYLGSWL